MANSLVIFTSNGYTRLRGTENGQLPVWNNDTDEWELGSGGGGGGGSGTVTSVTLVTTGTGLTVAAGGLTTKTINTSGTFTLGGTLGVGNGGTGVSSLTANALLVGGATVGGLSGSASGQLVRWNGSTGAWAATALTGTANQVVVTSDATSTTLSLPQSIATSSSPTFAGLTLTGFGGLIKANPLTGALTGGSAVDAATEVFNTLPAENGGTGLDLSGITDGELLIGQSTGALAAHALSGDATMDKDGEVTVTGLRGTSIANTPPVTGQVLQFDGTNYTPGVIPTGGSGGGGITYYFNYGTTTGISPTDGLPTTPVAPSLLGRSHVANATPLTSGDLVHDTMSLICGFVTSVNDPAITNIPAGLWDFNIWASAPDSSAVNQTAIMAKVYRYRSSDSSYLQIGASDAVYLYDLATRAQYILSVVVEQTTILATDRIYIELWAQKTANPGQLRRVMFYFQADAPTHVHTTLPSVAGTGIAHVVDGVFQSPAAPISLNSSDTSGQLPVGKGGTGQASLTNHALLVGQGTSAVASLLGTATGQIVYWNGTDWTSPSLASVAVTSISSTHMTVSNSGVGAVTLTLPQAIGTSSTVTFAQVNTDTVSAPSGTFSILSGIGPATTVIAPPAAATASGLSLEGGAASTGDANGGSAYLLGGAKSGTGTHGAVYIGTSNTSAITIGATNVVTTVAGTLAATTAAAGTNTTQVATCEFVTTAVSNAAGTPYDLPCEIPGIPSDTTRVVNFIAVRAFVLSTTGHQGGCAVANPTGSAVSFDVKKVASGVTTTLGTITFNTDGTFTSNITATLVNRTFAAGNVLTVTTPSALNSMDTPFWTLAMALV